MRDKYGLILHNKCHKGHMSLKNRRGNCTVIYVTVFAICIGFQILIFMV